MTSDLRTYVETALFDANPQLSTEARDGLQSGDLTPGAPFDNLPTADGGNEQRAHFAITGKSG